jgi:hypothetical protein
MGDLVGSISVCRFVQKATQTEILTQSYTHRQSATHTVSALPLEVPSVPWEVVFIFSVPNYDKVVSLLHSIVALTVLT